MGIAKVTWSHKGEILINRISVFVGRDPRELHCVCSLSVPRGQRKALWGHGRQPSATQGQSPHRTPTQLPEKRKKKICCSSHPACGMLLWLPELINTGRFKFGKCWKDPWRDSLLPPRRIFFSVVLFLCEDKFQKWEKEPQQQYLKSLWINRQHWKFKTS